MITPLLRWSNVAANGVCLSENEPKSSCLRINKVVLILVVRLICTVDCARGCGASGSQMRRASYKVLLYITRVKRSAEPSPTFPKQVTTRRSSQKPRVTKATSINASLIEIRLAKTYTSLHYNRGISQTNGTKNTLLSSHTSKRVTSYNKPPLNTLNTSCMPMQGSAHTLAINKSASPRFLGSGHPSIVITLRPLCCGQTSTHSLPLLMNLSNIMVTSASTKRQM